MPENVKDGNGNSLLTNPIPGYDELAAYAMLSGANATGPDTLVRGGSYVFSVELGPGGALNGATVKLQRRTRLNTLVDLPTPISTTTLPFQANVGAGHGTTLVAVITGGPPSNVFADLSEVR